MALAAVPPAAGPEVELPSVLHHLVVKGFASVEALVPATGLERGDVNRALAALGAAGWAVGRDGRAVSGWSPTPSGRARHQELLAGPLAPADPDAIRDWYLEFAPLNAELKQLCTDWQLRRSPNGQLIANDHRSPAYDSGVRRRLAGFDARVGASCARLEAALPRATRYRSRLAAARAAFVAGDGDRLAKPASESYHDVWMELHEDLLLTLGLARTSADA